MNIAHIDIVRPLGHALLQDLEALIDQREEEPVDDLLVSNLAPLRPILGSHLFRNLLHDWSWHLLPILVVVVEALPRLLPKAASLDEGVLDDLLGLVHASLLLRLDAEVQ